LEEIDKTTTSCASASKVPLEQHDWRGVDPLEQDKRIKSFLVSDRASGFDFSQAPLMRLTVLRLADHSYQIVWSKHHLILDGWSAPLVLEEVFNFTKRFVSVIS